METFNKLITGLPSLSYGQCGIIEVVLTDPFSKFISSIINIDGYNAVGLYYKNEIELSTYTVALFNVYNDSLVPWLRLGTNMATLINSPFVSKVSYRSLNISTVMFKPLAIETVKRRSNTDYNIIVNNLHLCPIPLERIVETRENGYTLINKILANFSTETLELSSTKISSCRLLSRTSTLLPVKDSIFLPAILDAVKAELTKVAGVIINRYVYDESFQKFFSGNTVSSDLVLKQLLIALSAGTIHRDLEKSLNDTISNINMKRANNSLPRCDLSHIVTKSSDVVMVDTNKMKILGERLSSLVSGSYPVDINKLVTAYNECINNTDISPIPMETSSCLHSVSSKILVFAPDYLDDSEVVMLSMDEDDLGDIPSEKLYFTLLYLDSLRSSDGTYDTRFSSLQRSITRELGSRDYRFET
jgi:hypothetical protein